MDKTHFGVVIIPKYDQGNGLFEILPNSEPVYGLQLIKNNDFALISLEIIAQFEPAILRLKTVLDWSMDKVFCVTVTGELAHYRPILEKIYDGLEQEVDFRIESEEQFHHILLGEPPYQEPILGDFSYLAWREQRGLEEVLYLVQNIVPGSKSTEHEHRKPKTPSREVYLPLFGESRLSIERRGVKTLVKPNFGVKWILVNPGQAHQIQNYGEYTAQNFLVMRPAPKGRDDRTLTSRL